MNKKNTVFLMILFAAIAVLFSSCSSSVADEEALLTGLWADTEYSSVNYEFKDDGSARMLGFDVEETGEKAELSWKADGYHLEINDMLLFYSCAYVYELSDDGNTLDLYCTAIGFLNMSYDSIYPGKHITLNRSDEMFLQDLVAE